jgi:hypothetical protein
MGQQQEIVTGSVLRHMILALTVAALMAVMLVAVAAPAFANSGGVPAVTFVDPDNHGGGPPVSNQTQKSGSVVNHNGGGSDNCVLHFGGAKNQETSGGDPGACF